MTADPRVRDAAAQVLDRLPYALVVVDYRLSPVLLNARARAALAAGALRLANGRVHAGNKETDDALRAAVDAATSPATSWLAGTAALRLEMNGAMVPVLIVPGQARVDPLLLRRSLALIVFGEGERLPHLDLLRAMYGFTAREGELACALMSGQDLAEAAIALGMAVPTARTHLQRLLDKTATRRQSELLRLLIGAAP